VVAEAEMQGYLDYSTFQSYSLPVVKKSTEPTATILRTANQPPRGSVAPAQPVYYAFFSPFADLFGLLSRARLDSTHLPRLQKKKKSTLSQFDNWLLPT
jgi:hypothetical protein